MSPPTPTTPPTPRPPLTADTPAPPVAGPARLWHAAGLSPLGVLVTRAEVVLGGMFAWAAWNKLYGVKAPQVFAASVEAFKLGLPDWATRMATSVTPWTEAVAATLLLLGVWTRAAATVMGLLLVFFIAIILRAILLNLDLECGCFGKLSPVCVGKVGWCNVWQNTALLAMAALIAFTPRHRLVRAPLGG